MVSRSLLLPSVAWFALVASPAVSAAEPQLEVRGNCAVQRVAPNNLYRSGSADPIFYLNRCAGGCEVTHGSNDSRYDTSTVFGHTVTLSEFAHGDEVWDEMVACIREVLLPYDVTVTEEDPGTDALYLESMIAGDTTESGLGPKVMGVSPIACSPLSHTISFTFANSHEPDARELCETVTHEAGHTLSLDHEVSCSELMWWTTGDICGPKFFRDRREFCGEEQPGECHCGGVYQNAHDKLLDAYGVGPGPVPPEVSIELPHDGDNVPTQFVVHAFASDDRGIGSMELHINGWRWFRLDGHSWSDRNDPYVLRTSSDLPDGILDVEVRALNDLGVTTSDTVTLMKGAPCTSADTCLEGQYCEEGRCLWDAPSQALGEDCLRDQQCLTLDCVQNQGLSLCVSACDPDDSGPCEDGYACIETVEGPGFCWPAEEGGGCCSASEARRPPWLDLGLFLGVILLASRRRRR